MNLISTMHFNGNLDYDNSPHVHQKVSIHCLNNCPVHGPAGGFLWQHCSILETQSPLWDIKIIQVNVVRIIKIFKAIKSIPN